ncbi:hypothetical protein HDU97_009214 [Phlyctochytrium planicorne]|nr:hypothetical protein HDU97_009214 [Phlyctochytrium planicorne]
MSDLQGESAIWSSIWGKIQALDDSRKVSDGPISRINKIHRKVLVADKFTPKVAKKLVEYYTEALKYTRVEKQFGNFIFGLSLRYKFRLISDVVENSSVLCALLQSDEAGTDVKRKKRKTDEKGKSSSKKSKFDESYTPLAPGSQVVVKPMNQDFMMAVVVQYSPEKQKYEVEDAEEDENEPGTRKSDCVPCAKYLTPKLVLPIPAVPRSPEFPTNHTVLALYPSSSCFYRATVIRPPSKNLSEEPELKGLYVVGFEDDNNHERYIDPLHVLDMPYDVKRKIVR